jgi:polar amino acid transport system permease protein
VLALLPDWVHPVAEYMAREGLKGTARVAVISVLASVILGIPLGTLLTIRFLPSRALIRLYIEIWRGLPIIVTIFMIYFVLPKLGPFFRFDPFISAAIGLSLWGSAQVAETTRGAVESIPREQHEAAAALGFGWVGTQRYVILPQALRRLLPPLVSLLVNVIQNTTIAALIGVAEVLQTGQRSVERLQLTPPSNSHAFEIYGGVMVLFFVISFPLTQLARYLERRRVV